MENLNITGVHDVYFRPTVNLDADTGILEITGESYLEETVKFYKQILTWIENYIQEIDKPITFNFRLDYYNTTTSRSILDILDLLKLYQDKEGIVDVNWYCKEEELEYLQEDIEDLAEDSDIEINLIVL